MCPDKISCGSVVEPLPANNNSPQITFFHSQPQLFFQLIRRLIYSDIHMYMLCPMQHLSYVVSPPYTPKSLHTSSKIKHVCKMGNALVGLKKKKGKRQKQRKDNIMLLGMFDRGSNIELRIQSSQ